MQDVEFGSHAFGLERCDLAAPRPIGGEQCIGIATAEAEQKVLHAFAP